MINKIGIGWNTVMALFSSSLGAVGMTTFFTIFAMYFILCEWQVSNNDPDNV